MPYTSYKFFTEFGGLQSCKEEGGREGGRERKIATD